MKNFFITTQAGRQITLTDFDMNSVISRFVRMYPNERIDSISEVK